MAQHMRFVCLQDKEQALQLLAAKGGTEPVLSAEEKQALSAVGKAAQEAAAAQLASQLQETEEALKRMDQDSRGQWFEVSTNLLSISDTGMAAVLACAASPAAHCHRRQGHLCRKNLAAVVACTTMSAVWEHGLVIGRCCLLNPFLHTRCCCCCAAQDHTCQSTAHAAKSGFEDEWSQLPADVLAMVQELQSRQ